MSYNKKLQFAKNVIKNYLAKQVIAILVNLKSKSIKILINAKIAINLRKKNQNQLTQDLLQLMQEIYVHHAK